jgi:hypothetical protein
MRRVADRSLTSTSVQCGRPQNQDGTHVSDKVYAFALASMKIESWIILLIPTLTLSVGSLFGADVLTSRYNPARTSLNPDEIALTPSTVQPSQFTNLATIQVDGRVFAQPLYVSSVPIFSGGQFKGRFNLVLIGTEHDTLYAFDADSGMILWKKTMLGPGEIPSDPLGTTDLTPELGITATPVVDRAIGTYGTVFVEAISKTSNSSSYFNRLHAIDLSTGNDRLTPVVISAKFPDPQGNGPSYQNGYNIFNDKLCRERAGLVQANGKIYTSWGSYGDQTYIGSTHVGYSGWVIAYDEKTLVQTNVFNADPNGTPRPSSDLVDGSGGGIWQSGAAPGVDGVGNIYTSTGNGPFDQTVGDYGDTVLKLSPTLSVLDYFTPFDAPIAANTDADLASGGSMLMNILDSTNTVHKLALSAGKDHNIYVVNRDNMGHYNSSNNSQIYQELAGALPNGTWSSPAYFNGHVYWGSPGNGIRRFTFNSSAKLGSSDSITPTMFGYPGATPAISSFGNQNGIVWAVSYTGEGNPAQLYAYDALNLSNIFYTSAQNIGDGDKFIQPTVCNGYVFIGTANALTVFGLYSPTVATDVSKSVAITRFAQQITGTSVTQSVTIKNNSASTIQAPISLVIDSLNNTSALVNGSGSTSITTPSGSAFVNVNSTLIPGQSLTVPLVFYSSNQKAVTYTTRVLSSTGQR